MSAPGGGFVAALIFKDDPKRFHNGKKRDRAGRNDAPAITLRAAGAQRALTKTVEAAKRSNGQDLLESLDLLKKSLTRYFAQMRGHQRAIAIDEERRGQAWRGVVVGEVRHVVKQDGLNCQSFGS